VPIRALTAAQSGWIDFFRHTVRQIAGPRLTDHETRTDS
jgi:hypothetical protein